MTNKIEEQMVNDGFIEFIDEEAKEEEQPKKKGADYLKERMPICRSCEHFKMNVCARCGCFMPVKTRFSWAECPIGKW